MKEITNEKKNFILDLQCVFEGYIDEVNQVVLEHIDELYEDNTIVYMVSEYAKEYRQKEHFNEEYLLNTYLYGNKVCTHSLSLTARAYGEALYQLCYRRYKKEV